MEQSIQGKEHLLPPDVLEGPMPTSWSNPEKMSAWVARGLLDGMPEAKLKAWTK